MGLDWIPENKPKPGHEEEFARLVRIKHERSSAEWEEVEDRFDEISVSPYETLNVPQVGRDKEADDWLRKIWEEDGRRKDWEEFYEEFRGHEVCELIPASDGKPFYSNGGVGGYIDELSFRGEFLNDCHKIMETESFAGIYSHKSGAELLRYGEVLLANAEAYAAKCEIDLEAMARLSYEELDEDERMLDIIVAAGKWAVFFGRHGHGMMASF